MVIALSPALIMTLVGSLCFFLIEVLYRGKMMGVICWTMFWFIVGVTLITRVAIEVSRDRAAVLGLALACVTWLRLASSQPAYLLGMLLLAIVWFCSHQLVWDCTLIDEDEDSSGHGLLQQTAKPAPARPAPAKKLKRKMKVSQNPGRWVIYFSLAALPLFGIGQMLLPSEAVENRRAGFIYLTIYLASALGLLVTTSFLGLRRYLRQRYIRMPAVIAFGWIKFGAGVAVAVLVLAIFVPRPGATAAWLTLRYQVDRQLGKASKYMSPPNPPGHGEGKPGSDSGGKNGEAKQSGDKQNNKPTSSGNDKPASGQPQPGSTPPHMESPTGNAFKMLRSLFWIIAGLVVLTWVFRRRHMLMEMLRSIIKAIRDLMSRFLDGAPVRKSPRPEEPAFGRPRYGSFGEYKNPFFAAKDHIMAPEQIILYTYEAVQVWAKEQGLPARPQETAREYAARLRERFPALDRHIAELARFYAHAAYGTSLPPNSELEPVRELWREMPVYLARMAATAR